jgi:HSP20 family protein
MRRKFLPSPERPCDAQASTPGLNKNEISVEVAQGEGKHDFLIISGESKESTEKDGVKSAFYSKFQRKVRIPSNLPKENISAKYEDGLLTVKITPPVPAVEEPKKVERIAIA